MPDLPPTDGSSPARRTAWRSIPTAALVLILFMASALWIALAVPFPTGVDESEHYSVVRAQAERPDLFADAARYGVLQAEELSAYINYPPTYYLVPAPLTRLCRDVLAMRLFSIVLAVTAVGVAIVASSRLLPTRLGWSVFSVLAACFTRAAAIVGMINNDNLATAAGAALIGLLPYLVNL